MFKTSDLTASEMGRIHLRRFATHVIQWCLQEIEFMRAELLEVHNDDEMPPDDQEALCEVYYEELLQLFILLYPARHLAFKLYPECEELIFWSCGVIEDLRRSKTIPDDVCDCDGCGPLYEEEEMTSH